MLERPRTSHLRAHLSSARFSYPNPSPHACVFFIAVSNILSKLDLQDRTQLAIYAIKKGLVDSR